MITEMEEANSEENNRDASVYFTEQKWLLKSNYEKQRMHNMLNIYFDMIETAPRGFIPVKASKLNNTMVVCKSVMLVAGTAKGFELEKPEFMLEYENKQKNKTKKIVPKDKIVVIDNVEKVKVKTTKTKSDQSDNEDTIKERRYPKRKIATKDYFEEQNLDDDCYIYCDICMNEYVDGCIFHPLIHVKDVFIPKRPKNSNRARDTLRKDYLRFATSHIPNAGEGVWTSTALEMGLKFGPYEGIVHYEENDGCYSWEIKKNGKTMHYIDGFDMRVSNWMRYVNCARHKSEQNLVAYNYLGQMYYRTVCDIKPNTELLVYYGDDFAKKLGILTKNFFLNSSNYLANDQVYKCDHCHLAFSEQAYLTNHLKRSHSVYNIIDIPNPNAGKPVPSSTEAESEELFEPSPNDVHFETKGTVGKQNKRLFVCTICKKSFTTKYDLKVHLRIHTGENLYKCDICQKTFKQSSDLISHKRIHSGERPYKCDICQKTFKQSNGLIYHKRIHSGERPYKCDICQKTFKQSSELIYHKRIHSGERPYKCDICQKTFKQSNGLIYHKRIHSGERPYKCDICQKTFKQSSGLIQHKRIHSGERPYKCDICQKAFNRSGHLIRHKRIHSSTHNINVIMTKNV